MIKIHTNSSTHDAKFTHEDGYTIHNVAACDVRMRPDEIVKATLDILVDEATIWAEPLLALDTIREAAKCYGYELVEKGE